MRYGILYRFFLIALLVAFFFSSFSYRLDIEQNERQISETNYEIMLLKYERKYAILQKIAYCESGNRQFDKNGNVIRGIINHHDIGKYQINEIIWGTKAKELGFDIYTEEGNEAMARWIFDNYGTTKWNWSKSCWDPTKNN